jgi:class 3 adenylate cyclase
MRCAECGADNREGRKFCAKCAAPLARLCPQCGASNEPAEDFCGECATPLAKPSTPSAKKATNGPISAAETPASENLEGERKVVTFLFGDIKGSMDLMEDLDPEEARAIVDPALKLMMEAVHHYGGYVAQLTGDGIFALFGAPVAHEDHPQRALFAALRLQEEMRRYSAKLRVAGNLPVEARVGVNTGEVVVRSIKTGQGNVEYAPIGHSTGLAARMQALAPTGSIAATDAVRKPCEGYFTFKTLGPAKVKGVTEPVEVYEVTGFGPLRTRLQRSASRGYTKFVGRQREMEELRHCAELARQGHGQMVAVVADAGVGKSRLFQEFKATLEPYWMILEAFPISHGKASPYLPVLDLLHRYFGIKDDDDGHKRREKVAIGVARLDRALEDALPFLFGLLGLVEGDDPLAGMDTQIKRRRTLDALRRILMRESLTQPVVLVFEDLHLIDEETQAFLNLLADSIRTARLLLLVNYRPEYSHPWNNKTYYRQLRLDPLAPESAEQMISAQLGDGQDLMTLKRLIIEKTEGNPFFMEETVQALFEDGALRRNGTVKLVKPLTLIKVPATVQAVLASRIDRLPQDQKELLQILAVIGKKFPLALARGLIEKPDDDLERMFNNLQVAELIYEQPGVGDDEYIFNHSVTQEVAYDSVLIERRKVLHERVGQSMESLYADSLGDHVADLVHHYRHSGNSGKAIDYALLAAEQAMGRNAPNEAVAGLTDGLTLLGGISNQTERTRREAALRLALCGAASFGRLAAPGIEERYQLARELCERSGNSSGVFTALFQLRFTYNLHSDYDRALQMCTEMFKIAPNCEPSLLIGAHLSASETLYNRGEFRAAQRHQEEARAIPADETVKNPVLRNGLTFMEPLSKGALILAVLGYPDRAVQQDREALAKARQKRNPLALANSEFSSAQLYHFVGMVEQVREHSDVTFRIQNELGESLSGYASAFLGWVDAMQGDPARGIRQIERAVETINIAGGSVLTLPNALLAECHLRNGTIEEGLAVVSDALNHAQNTGEKHFTAELNRLRGELLQVRGLEHQLSAESAFRIAIEVARTQQARWWELRATTSLARLLRATNRPAEACAMLGEIYNWFTEGFDTADLKAAKALLDELSA